MEIHLCIEYETMTHQYKSNITVVSHDGSISGTRKLAGNLTFA